MEVEEPGQPFVLVVPARLLRRVRLLLGRDDASYADLNEFMEAAIETQLNLSKFHLGDLPGTDPVPPLATLPGADAPTLSRFVVHPLAAGVEAAPDPPPGEALFVLTNRLAPMAFGMRMLVNHLAASGGRIPLGRYLTSAARAAREIGLHLRTEDRALGRTTTERRWIGWPVGDDEAKALERFKWSFLLSERLGKGTGPLVDLGLADVIDGRALPTAAGKALGGQPSPLLGETAGWTLGEEQVRTLSAAIKRSPAEANEIALFASLVADSGGRQPVVDHELQKAHHGWSAARAVAHRAAIVGRLRDLGAAEVRGSGGSAVITVSKAHIEQLIEGENNHEAVT